MVVPSDGVAEDGTPFVVVESAGGMALSKCTEGAFERGGLGPLREGYLCLLLRLLDGPPCEPGPPLMGASGGGRGT